MIDSQWHTALWLYRICIEGVSSQTADGGRYQPGCGRRSLVRYIFVLFCSFSASSTGDYEWP